MPPANMAPYAKQGARCGMMVSGPASPSWPPAWEQPPAGEFPEGERSIPANLRSRCGLDERLGAPGVEIVQRKDPDGKPTRDFDVNVAARPPQVCMLGARVREAFYRYYDGLRGLAAASDNTDLDANYTRFAKKALRVAILLASLDDRGAGPVFSGVIELRHWARSQAIAERWRQSLHNLYMQLNAEQDEAGQKEDG